MATNCNVVFNACDLCAYKGQSQCFITHNKTIKDLLAKVAELEQKLGQVSTAQSQVQAQVTQVQAQSNNQNAGLAQ